MVLTVDVLPVWPLHRVRARVDVEGPWTLQGHANGETWTVAEGEGPTWLSDPWAPLHMAVEYTLNGGDRTPPVVRSYAGESAMTDLTGQGVVDFRWDARGGDPMSQMLRHQFFDVPGSRLGPYMSAPVAGAGGGGLVARTVGRHTKAMRQLVARNVPVILHHAHVLCDVRDCDVPAVRTVVLTSASEDRTAHVDRARREWDLSYQLVPVPWGFLPPVATLGELTERWPTVGDLAGSGLTVGELAAGDWLVA